MHTSNKRNIITIMNYIAILRCLCITLLISIFNLTSMARKQNFDDLPIPIRRQVIISRDLIFDDNINSF